MDSAAGGGGNNNASSNSNRNSGTRKGAAEAGGNKKTKENRLRNIMLATQAKAKAKENARKAKKAKNVTQKKAKNESARKQIEEDSVLNAKKRYEAAVDAARLARMGANEKCKIFREEERKVRDTPEGHAAFLKHMNKFAYGTTWASLVPGLREMQTECAVAEREADFAEEIMKVSEQHYKTEVAEAKRAKLKKGK
jgi:hypothetical protein